MSVDTLTALLNWVTANSSPLLTGTGVILAVLCVLLTAKRWRHSTAATIGRNVTMPLVLAWEAHGLHEVATASGVSGGAAWVLALTTSAVLATLAAYADDHHREHANLGHAGRLVWWVAGPMGLIVATSADNATESALRIALPLLAALVWWVKYAPAVPADADGSPVRKRRGSWRYTPRYIGVELGLIVPNDDDIDVQHRERQTRQMVSLARRTFASEGRRARRYRARYERLAETADQAMMLEVVTRVIRAETGLTRVNPATTDETLLRMAESHRARLAAFAAELPADVEPVATAAPAELPADVEPVAVVKPTVKRAAPKKTTPRRPVEETRKLAAEALASAPDVTRKAVAEQLDITDRQLRRVLNEDTGTEQVNGRLPGQMTLT